MILDIMMPKRDGLSVLLEIRKRSIVTPVLLLTAKSEIDDRVTGLDAGADDYLSKPFAMKELMARVRAMTRRKQEYSSEMIVYGDISLSGETFELKCENSVRLSVKEFELLQALIRSSDRPLTPDYLMNNVWSNSPNATDETVMLYVQYLRDKLKAIQSKVSIINDNRGCFLTTAEQDH
jgi:DNA-binding response OmpR family regulator